nr:MAG TPA: hypothetical protein [Crassvirales sp.]
MLVVWKILLSNNYYAKTIFLINFVQLLTNIKL